MRIRVGPTTARKRSQIYVWAVYTSALVTRYLLLSLQKPRETSISNSVFIVHVMTDKSDSTGSIEPAITNFFTPLSVGRTVLAGILLKAKAQVQRFDKLYVLYDKQGPCQGCHLIHNHSSITRYCDSPSSSFYDRLDGNVRHIGRDRAREGRRRGVLAVLRPSYQKL